MQRFAFQHPYVCSVVHLLLQRAQPPSPPGLCIHVFSLLSTPTLGRQAHGPQKNVLSIKREVTRLLHWENSRLSWDLAPFIPSYCEVHACYNCAQRVDLLRGVNPTESRTPGGLFPGSGFHYLLIYSLLLSTYFHSFCIKSKQTVQFKNTSGVINMY